MFLIRRRRRFCLLIVASLIFITVFISEKLIVTPSNSNFLELDSCPKCFGIDLCPSLNNGNFRFTGFSRLSLFHGNSLNIKNVYAAVDSYFRAVRMKKLAHQTEWNRYDREKTSVHSSTDLFPCSINVSSTNEFRSSCVLFSRKTLQIFIFLNLDSSRRLVSSRSRLKSHLKRRCKSIRNRFFSRCVRFVELVHRFSLNFHSEIFLGRRERYCRNAVSFVLWSVWTRHCRQ